MKNALPKSMVLPAAQYDAIFSSLFKLIDEIDAKYDCAHCPDVNNCLDGDNCVRFTPGGSRRSVVSAEHMRQINAKRCRG